LTLKSFLLTQFHEDGSGLVSLVVQSNVTLRQKSGNLAISQLTPRCAPTIAVLFFEPLGGEAVTIVPVTAAIVSSPQVPTDLPWTDQAVWLVFVHLDVGRDE